MYDFQSLIFRSASRWSEVTSLVVIAVGLLYTLQGFRFARFLIALSCAGAGLAAGGAVANMLNLPLVVALASAGVLGIAALARFRWGLAVASTFTFGALAQYMATRIGLSPSPTLIIGGLGLVGGASLIWVCRRPLPILVTMVQGAALILVGFVGLTSAVAPTLGTTFVTWTTEYSLMAPAFMLMLCVMGYSAQANAYQGDITSGASANLRDLETS